MKNTTHDTIKCKYIYDKFIDIPQTIANSMGSFTGQINNGTTSTRETSKIMQILELTKEIDNPVFFDIGANYGGYSYITMFNENLKVEAFEPNPIVSEVFKHIVEKNSIPNININSFGLSDTDRKCALHWGPRNIGAATIKVNKDGDCVFKTLDSLNVQKMDFVKIDVEGHELEVLEGAREAIKRCKPIFLQIEINSGDRAKKLDMIKEDYLDNNYYTYRMGVDYLFFRKS